MKERKLVYIEWQDAHDPQANGWWGVDQIEAFAKGTEFFVHNVGFLYKETKKYIVLVGQWVPEGKLMGEAFAQIIKIPRGWIRKYKVLKP